MGRIIKKEIVGFKCQVHSCSFEKSIFPLPADSVWEDQVTDLYMLVIEGWALVLTPRIRSYCPVHAEQVFECTCKTNPRRKHLCVAHNEEAASLIWVDGDMPEVAAKELERIGVFA